MSYGEWYDYGMIEIEKRGLLTEEKYNQLLSFLDTRAEGLGEDNKDVVYYIYDDKLLKVVNNLSKNNAKVSLKMNKLGDSTSTREIEAVFNQQDYSKMKEILDIVAHAPQAIEGSQKRKNFMYKGCEIAVKWSKDWGHHFEIEKVTENELEVAVLEQELERVIRELDVTAMTNEEIQEFQKKIEAAAKK